MTEAEQLSLMLAAKDAPAIRTKDGKFVLFVANGYDPSKELRLDRLDGQRRWIAYGDDNQAPNYFLDMSRNSPTHGAILQKKAEFTAGSGVRIADPRLAAWCKGLDGGNGLEGEKGLLFKLALDWHTYGGYCLQIIWKKYRHEIADIRFQPFAEARRGFTSQRDDNDLYPQRIWICKDWPRYTWGGNKYNRPEEHELFDPACRSDQPTFQHVARYTQGTTYYPLPTWYSARHSILTEIELELYTYWSTRRGFTPAGILRVSGLRGEHAEEQLQRDVENSLLGAENAGKILVATADTMGESGSVPPIEYVPFSQKPFGEDVSLAREQARQTIVTAHGVVSPTVIGIPVATGLQSDAETIRAGTEELRRTMKVSQSEILGNLKRLFMLAGYSRNLDIKIIQTDGSVEGDNAKTQGNPQLDQLRATVGGLQAVSQIQDEVYQGLKTYDQGLGLLVVGMGYTDAEARRILGDPSKVLPPPSQGQPPAQTDNPKGPQRAPAPNA